MNVVAKFDEIPSMILEIIRKQNVTGTLSFGQRENRIPSHKHSLRGYNYCINTGAARYVLRTQKPYINQGILVSACC